MPSTKTNNTKQKINNKNSTLSKTIPSISLPKKGDIVEGKVLSLGKNCLLIDLGYTIGAVRGIELWQGLSFYPELKKGDKIKATIIELENEKGQIELSLREGGQKEAWEVLSKLQKEQKPVSIKILEANKGGLVSQLYGIIGFLPVSHLKPEHYPRVEGNKEKILDALKKFVGQNLKVKIIKIDQKEERLIFSEKEIFSQEEKEKLSKYKIGQIIKGRIEALTDFAAFIKFSDNEEAEGVIHVSEISWDPINKPEDKLKKDQEIEAKIIDREERKFSLSIKQLSPDPWLKKVEKYKVGQIIKGKIKEIKPFGIFVDLEKEILGFCPISTLGKIVLKEEEESFKILSILPEEHRIELSLRKV